MRVRQVKPCPKRIRHLPTVQGTATYRERIALPPNAIFEAVVQDVSRADAPAIEVGRTTVRQPTQVPIPFRITVNPADIDPKRNYSVRGRILVDGKLWFASDMVYPVLMDGASSTVDMLLKRVASSAQEGTTVVGGEVTTYMARNSPGARLYVTFEGSLANRPRLEGTGTETAVVVRSFIDAWPNQNCERSRANASLANRYWRITELAGNPVPPPTGSQREPQLILRDADGKQTYSQPSAATGSRAAIR